MYVREFEKIYSGDYTDLFQQAIYLMVESTEETEKLIVATADHHVLIPRVYRCRRGRRH
jgi:hypothetical protein